MNIQHGWISKNILSKRSHTLKRVDTTGFQVNEMWEEAKQFYNYGTQNSDCPLKGWDCGPK